LEEKEMKLAVRTYKENSYYIAENSEFDIASQGKTLEEAKSNLREAIELFLEYASKNEIDERLNKETQFSEMEISIG
jgi:predicted RNase H-like HicB family nuclease